MSFNPLRFDLLLRCFERKELNVEHLLSSFDDSHDARSKKDQLEEEIDVIAQLICKLTSESFSKAISQKTTILYERVNEYCKKHSEDEKKIATILEIYKSEVLNWQKTLKKTETTQEDKEFAFSPRKRVLRHTRSNLTDATFIEPEDSLSSEKNESEGEGHSDSSSSSRRKSDSSSSLSEEESVKEVSTAKFEGLFGRSRKLSRAAGSRVLKEVLREEEKVVSPRPKSPDVDDSTKEKLIQSYAKSLVKLSRRVRKKEIECSKIFDQFAFSSEEFKKLSSWIMDEDVRHEFQDKILQSELGKKIFKGVEEQFRAEHPNFLFEADSAFTFNLLDELSNRINDLHYILDKNPLEYDDPNILAELRALKTLREEILLNPQGIADKIKMNKNEALYIGMGPLFYMSSLVQVEANIKSSSDDMAMQQKIQDAQKLTASEKVAIYGYTSMDFKGINKALREHQGTLNQEAVAAFNEELKEKYPAGKDLHTIQTYIMLALKGMSKLPDISSRNGDETVRLQRSISTFPTPTWENETFRSGLLCIDFGFSSVSLKDVGGGAARIEYFLAKPNDFTWKNAKDVSLFSAHPKEREIVFLPETKFICIESRHGYHMLQLKD